MQAIWLCKATTYYIRYKSELHTRSAEKKNINHDQLEEGLRSLLKNDMKEFLCAITS